MRLLKVQVYLSLGSNLGDREGNLRATIAALPSANFHVTKVSSFYETEPVDYLQQPWFLNCVVEGQTTSQPLDLLHVLRAIEANFGSKKAFAKGPRVLDIDILLFGEQTVDSPQLQIPHPRMLERNFVLRPLAEIAPKLRHPSWPANASELLAKTADPSVVRPLK
jgi:2-amino-4-hydroxy-6-hydroxymethyldihydropteridine diphosphokinase